MADTPADTILTVDTCTDAASLGLFRGGDLLGECSFPARHTVVTRLLPRLDWLLAECGVPRHDISALALSLGPGSFTGVRLGAAFARVLAATTPVHLVGVPTLLALAHPFRAIAATIVPFVNARRGQVYAAAWRWEGGSPIVVAAPCALSADALPDFLASLAPSGPLHVVGDSHGLPAPLADALSSAPACLSARVTPAALAALAAERLGRDEADDPATLSSIYLRPPAG